MGILYVVATPIGNMEDITYRGVRILKSVYVIACEDTRQTAKLLQRYDIKTKMISYHQHSKNYKIDEIIDILKSESDVALVSDAGTPAVSDPGAELIFRAIENKIKVVPIPGVSAVATLSSISGNRSGKFLFLGFLPKKKGRKTLLENIKVQMLNFKKDDIAIIIYESPYRIVRTLRDFSAIGDWQVVIGREMTKKFEEIIRGNIKDIIEKLKDKKIKGEVSICLSRV